MYMSYKKNFRKRQYYQILLLNVVVNVMDEILDVNHI